MNPIPFVPSTNSVPYVPYISESLCPFMERAIMGDIDIHPDDVVTAKHFVTMNRGMSMMAALVCALQKQQQQQQEQEQQKSKKDLIIHNIPYDSTESDLRLLFEKYGPLKEIYIPKNRDKKSPHHGTIKGFAVVKYLRPESAKKAYDAEFGRLYIGYRLISIEYADENK